MVLESCVEVEMNVPIESLFPDFGADLKILIKMIQHDH